MQAIGDDVTVESIETSDVGMTAGYFSSIVRVKLNYSKPCAAPPSMIVKSWPPFEILPKDSIKCVPELKMTLIQSALHLSVLNTISSALDMP